MDPAPSPASSRHIGGGPPAPMRVEVRLWDLEHALILEPSSFDVVREEIGEENALPRPSSCDFSLVDRTKPAVTVEMKFDHQASGESRLHSIVVAPKQPQVNWLHSPLRSQLVTTELREVLIFSLHPAALEGNVTFKLYQWACISEQRLASVSRQAKRFSDGDANDESIVADTMCSVSEQDESELLCEDAAVKLCIGSLKVPLRSLLQLDRQVRLKLQLDAALRGEVQHMSDHVYDAVAGTSVGGVASLSCHVSAFFAECVLPSPPQQSRGTSMTGKPAGLLNSARNGRASSQESNATSTYSLIGTDTLELQLLLIPIRVVNDLVRLMLDIVLWRRLQASIAALAVVALATIFDLFHVLGVAVLVAITVRCHRSARIASAGVGEPQTSSTAMLYPPSCVFLNGLIRGDLWLQSGHSDEAFIEVVHLGRRLSSRAASISVTLWVTAVLYVSLPLSVFVPGVSAVALVLYPLLHTAVFGISVRRRTAAGGGDMRLGPWELWIPKAYTRTPLPVTRLVKAFVHTTPRRFHSSVPSLRSSINRRGVIDFPTDAVAPIGPEPTESRVKLDNPVAQPCTSDVPSILLETTGGTNTYVTDLEVSPESPTPPPRVPKLQLTRRDSGGGVPGLPPPPLLSARAHRRESDNASSHVSSERIETPRARAPPKSTQDSDRISLPRRHSATVGMLAAVSSTHRRTHSQLVTAAPAFSFAVITVEWRDDGAMESISPVRSVFNSNSSATMVKERLRQYYHKLEAAEQRLQEGQSPTVVDSGGSISGNTSAAGKLSASSQSMIHDHVVAEATLLLLYLRRMWKSAVVHVSTSSVPAAESAGAAVDRLERIAHPGTLMEHVSSDQVTSTLLSGFAQFPVMRLTGSRGLDENCRAWALLCMCLLNGKRVSLFVPHGQAKISFLVPLQPHALTFEPSNGGTKSCPPPLLPALQDLWRGWSEGKGKDAHSLVTLDMILTIISAHRDYWKHNSVSAAVFSPSVATPPLTAAATNPVGIRRRDTSTQRAPSGVANPSPQRPPPADEPLMDAPISSGQSHMSPVEATSHRVASTPQNVTPFAQPLRQQPAHDTPFLDAFAGASTSFETELSGQSNAAASTKSRRNVYESLGIKSHRKGLESPEATRAAKSVAQDAYVVQVPQRGASPPPQSPPRPFQEPFPSFDDSSTR